MAYQVTLTLLSGERMRGADIYRIPTPAIGDEIEVIARTGKANARVTGIRKHRSWASAATVETVDDVDAKEF